MADNDAIEGMRMAEEALLQALECAHQVLDQFSQSQIDEATVVEASKQFFKHLETIWQQGSFASWTLHSYAAIEKDNMLPRKLIAEVDDQATFLLQSLMQIKKFTTKYAENEPQQQSSNVEKTETADSSLHQTVKQHDVKQENDSDVLMS
eukprot:TRINITY_DN10752_c0_g1_i1.p1 TRINITY_DN10752_c0_g1~~TRINITY_DN10752_c0_g1_i1.p1  ORF type:complete len:150 (+),score=43.15 TRINITY_DN10752_c0_g1_i1:81-530(+)